MYLSKLLAYILTIFFLIPLKFLWLSFSTGPSSPGQLHACHLLPSAFCKNVIQASIWYFDNTFTHLHVTDHPGTPPHIHISLASFCPVYVQAVFVISSLFGYQDRGIWLKSKMMAGHNSPFPGLWLCSMFWVAAQDHSSASCMLGTILCPYLFQ